VRNADDQDRDLLDAYRLAHERQARQAAAERPLASKAAPCELA
jgi:hypothetical protein